MKIEVITSFNQSYYDIIGKESVESWLKYWPTEMFLTCYIEEFELPTHARIKQISFDQLDKEYTDFQNTAQKQVKKFAKKAFTFIHAMEHSTADRIIWMDADVLTIKTLPKNLLCKILPDDVLSTHLGVTYYFDKEGNPGTWFVPETGFFAVNTTHKLFNDFKYEYKKCYVEKNITGLRRFYDNDVYGHVIKKLQAPSYDLTTDLSKGYKTPLPHTELGNYLQHYKAKGSKKKYLADKKKT